MTPARNLRVNFSHSYGANYYGLAAHKTRMAGANSAEDFNRPEVVFALRRGTIPVEVVRAQMPKATIRQFDDEAAALQELLNGRADAFVGTEPQPSKLAAEHPDKIFLPIDGHLASDHAGIAIRKGDTDTLNYINNWIAVKKNLGWLQARRDYWFKGEEWKPLVGGEVKTLSRRLIPPPCEGGNRIASLLFIIRNEKFRACCFRTAAKKESDKTCRKARRQLGGGFF